LVVSQNLEGMHPVERQAEEEFDRRYDQHKREITDLKEQRRRHYKDYVLQPWLRRISLGYCQTVAIANVQQKLRSLKSINYIEDDGQFRTDHGTWERSVVDEVLGDTSAVGWLLNVDRKQVM
jgi:hypothetical protein